MIILIVVCFGLVLYIQSNFRNANRELKRLFQVNQGKLLAYIGETIRGVQTIRAF